MSRNLNAFREIHTLHEGHVSMGDLPVGTVYRIRQAPRYVFSLLVSL